MLEEAQKVRFCAARRAAIARDFSHLNPEQQKGVLATEGPLLLLAGAGSGKTTVLINRVVNLIRYGKGSDSDQVPEWVTEEDLAFLEHYAQTGEGDRERQVKLCALDPAPPWSILAITFTNRAADELRERLTATVGAGSQQIWAFTFHAACVRILRRYIDRLGFPTTFTIYDTEDSLRVIRDTLKALGLSDRVFPPRKVLTTISKAKMKGQLSKDYSARASRSRDSFRRSCAQIYEIYEKTLWDAGGLDFDDLILHTVRLLNEFEEVRVHYQNQFRYVLVDEYQDTNLLQYELTACLAAGRKNLCVVGDDDQSIYRFRGATIDNILTFEEKNPGCRTIRLEQNYRSTGNILDAANAVIANNQGRKGKTLWTDVKGGEPVHVCEAATESDEAQYVAEQIVNSCSSGRNWRDHAILYRMNAQSNQLENMLKRSGIPYRIFGGTRFFDRMEIRDMLAYLDVMNNPQDNMRLLRIINTPPRGIGSRTVEVAKQLAEENHCSIFAILRNAASFPALDRARGKLQAFVELLEELHSLLLTMPLDSFYVELVKRTGYGPMLESRNTEEDKGRLENVWELLTSIRGYMASAGEESGEDALFGFLSEIALFTDLDNHDADQDCVVLMTMHSAKGLEFPVVFVTGMESGLFPDSRSIGDPQGLEEERRLCYVAMTRARESLHLVWAHQRMLYGQTRTNEKSTFLEEVPEELIETVQEGHVRKPERRGYDPYEEEDLSDGDDEVESEYLEDPWSNRGSQSRSASRGGHGGYGGYGGYGGAKREKAKPWNAGPTSRTYFALKVGDVVRHKSFGEGTVLSITPMAGDAMLEIAFESGTRRLMRGFAMRYMEKV